MDLKEIESVEVAEKPVAKPILKPLTLAGVAIAAALAGLSGGEIADNAEAQKRMEQAKHISAVDSVLAPAVIAPVDVDITDSVGKILRTEKQMREVKPRNVKNCDTKYNCPLVTKGDETFTTITTLSRPGLPDSTLSVIVDRPIADRLHVVYTTTAEK